MTDYPKRRWFRFSMRELALVVLAFGLTLGWYREHTYWEPVRNDMEILRGRRPPYHSSGPLSQDGPANTSYYADDSLPLYVIVTSEDPAAK